MDGKKRRGRRRSSSSSDAECDETALAKAAAWAWHQRGSLHDGRAPRPHEPRAAPRPRPPRPRPPRPSRYQLEARASSAAAPPPPSGEKRSPPPPPRGSISLFDLYEIECITRELQRLIAASDGRPTAAPKEAASDSRRATRKPGIGGGGGGGGGGGRGFLGRQAATICGAMVEAVEATAPLLVQRRRRRSKVL